MGGPGSTGSAEDGVDTAVNATSQNYLPDLTPTATLSGPSQGSRIPIASYATCSNPNHTTAQPHLLCSGLVAFSGAEGKEDTGRGGEKGGQLLIWSNAEETVFNKQKAIPQPQLSEGQPLLLVPDLPSSTGHESCRCPHFQIGILQAVMPTKPNCCGGQADM